MARATSGGQVTPSGPGQGTGGGTQALGGLGWQGEDRGQSLAESEEIVGLAL